MVGRTISHYRILRQLGRGGMGEVYEAEDLNLHRRVALKVLPPEVAQDAERLQRFQREAETLARLNHPRIVTIYSVEEADGVRFLTMEYVQGSTLREEISAGGLPADRLLYLAHQLSQALAAAHERGVLHRDLKPENVLIDQGGQLKILDFGLAKSNSSEAATVLQGAEATLTIEGQLLGTVPYMSPEQAEGRSLDERSDIFSLGVILYEMATGTRPFSGETQMALLSAILRDPPAPVDGRRSDLPRRLIELVERCLEKDPAKRPQSALEMLDELNAVEASRSSAAAGTGWRARIRPTPGRLLWSGAIVVVAAVALIGVQHVRQERTPAATLDRPIRSIAVLPLANLSGDPKQEYFADGMTEALTTDLAKIKALRVTSRTSVMRFKNSELPMRQIGKALNVDAVLEGSVMQAGGKVRIDAQLIDARTDSHLWAESYERDAGDVLVLQDAVARAVAGEIQVHVTAEERQRLASDRTVDPQAHELYLRGMEAVQQIGPENARYGAELFQKAIQIDPKFALAYVGLTRAYTALAYSGIDPEAQVAKAREMAEKALQLRPDLAMPHMALAYIDFTHDWDWQAAEREFRAGLALNQGNADARIPYGIFLMCTARVEEARSFIDETVARDPLSPRTVIWGGWVRLESGDAAGAEVWAHRVLDLKASDTTGHWLLGRAYLQRGDLDRAIDELQRAADLSGRDPVLVGTLAFTLARAGRRREAQDLLAEPTVRSENGAPMPFVVAALQTGLGDHAAALDALDAAIARHAPPLMYLGVESLWDDLRGEPRFQELLRKMNFPPRVLRRSAAVGQRVAESVSRTKIPLSPISHVTSATR